MISRHFADEIPGLHPLLRRYLKEAAAFAFPFVPEPFQYRSGTVQTVGDLDWDDEEHFVRLCALTDAGTSLTLDSLLALPVKGVIPEMSQYALLMTWFNEYKRRVATLPRAAAVLAVIDRRWSVEDRKQDMEAITFLVDNEVPVIAQLELRILRYMLEEGNFAHVATRLVALLENRTVAHHPPALGTVQQLLAQTHYLLGRMDEALSWCRKSIQSYLRARPSPDKKGIGMSAKIEGDIFMRMAFFSKAVGSFRRAAVLSSAKPLFMLRHKRSEGEAHFAAGDVRAALECFDSVLSHMPSEKLSYEQAWERSRMLFFSCLCMIRANSCADVIRSKVRELVEYCILVIAKRADDLPPPLVASAFRRSSVAENPSTPMSGLTVPGARNFSGPEPMSAPPSDVELISLNCQVIWNGTPLTVDTSSFSEPQVSTESRGVVAQLDEYLKPFHGLFSGWMPLVGWRHTVSFDCSDSESVLRETWNTVETLLLVRDGHFAPPGAEKQPFVSVDLLQDSHARISVAKRFVHAHRSKGDYIVGVRTQSLVGHFIHNFVRNNPSSSATHDSLFVLPAHFFECGSTSDGNSHFMVESIGNGDVFSKATEDEDACDFQRYVWNVTRGHLCPWDLQGWGKLFTDPQLYWPMELNSLYAPFLSTIKPKGVPPRAVQDVSRPHSLPRAQ
jgi:tetratricopeptide (TPR) repeat protein